ncbi:hypothetical protein ABID97_001910 [Variovorax sp. OAS795]|uniref:hypothetical protein n=1 Tax=Variovorax sp. OAS795 TaxID=3034231 RepID=UPI003397EF53
MEALAERTTRRGALTPAVAATSAVSVPATTARLTGQQFDRITSHLSHSGSMLTMLIYMFAGQSSLDDVRDDATSEMVMGLVQHADNRLTAAYNELIGIEGRLPDEIRVRIFEAHSIVSLLERIGFSAGFDFEAFTEQHMVDYLSAAQLCIDQTNAGLTAHWKQQHA